MSIKQHRRGERRGFGLLEVVFSTALFIVVVGSLVGLSRLSLRNAVLSTHRSQAINLAQDGLEIVRQMRDTTWIQGPQTGETLDGKTWLTFPHDCSMTGTKYSTVIESTDTAPVNYALCYDTDFNPDQFGVKKQTGLDDAEGSNSYCDKQNVDPDFCLTLKSGATPAPDPGSPLYFKRTVRFEKLIPTNAPTDGCAKNQIFKGLQILAINDDGTLCVAPGVEDVHFIRVKVTVGWKDFDKNWDVSLSTLLTDWRAN